MTATVRRFLILGALAALTAPPQTRQVATLMFNTRFRRYAQLMNARGYDSAGTAVLSILRFA